MSELQQWLRMAAGIILMTAIFDLLLPANDNKKLAKLVMGLVIMMVLLEPILAVVYSGWRADWFSLGNSALPPSVNLADASSRIHSAGMQPVMQLVTENAAHQLEALLISSPAIADARITITMSEDGSITAVEVRVIPTNAAEQLSQKDLQELELLVKDLVSRYLQIAQANIYVEIG